MDLGSLYCTPLAIIYRGMDEQLKRKNGRFILLNYFFTYHCFHSDVDGFKRSSYPCIKIENKGIF